MLSKRSAISFLIVCLVISGCGGGQTTLPTAVPSYTPPSSPTLPPTSTPEATSTPEVIGTATITPTATPLPICHPGETVESAANGSLPGYVDILNVSTRIKGSNLTAVFSMSWLPDEIGIDRNILGHGSAEIAWGVAIDMDNDPNTGASIPLIDSGYGYEYALQAVNYKQGKEQQGDIQSLFSDKTHVWEYFHDGSSDINSAGKITVDKDAATLTISGNIEGISRESYLHFYAVYFPTDTRQLTDEICQR
jgi:hypothetical protein